MKNEIPSYLGGTFICCHSARINHKNFSPGIKVQVLSYNENEFNEELLTIQSDDKTYEVAKSFFEKNFVSMSSRGIR